MHPPFQLGLLGQPIQGVHPGRSGESSLEYLLDGAATIAADRGIFLATTWRMHPDVCRFISDAVYDGRLEAESANARRTLVLAPDAHRLLRPAGIVHEPIEHTGCSQRSEPEAALVREVYASALRQHYTDRDGTRHAMTTDNIVVVAPYNMQVNLLKRVLPEGARVGTVDKFQGQEAELVIVSMTTSSGQDLPRHIEFLYSKNRLNVAISRAKCLAIVIANPALTAIKCSTPEQMALVNTLCWVAEVGGRRREISGLNCPPSRWPASKRSKPPDECVDSLTMTEATSITDAWAQVRAGLALFSRPFPHAAIALAEEHRAEVAPQLAAELEALAAAPSQAGDDYMLHIFAMHLLAWWRDKRGLRPLLALGHLRDHALLESLFGDHLTESYGHCLASMSNGDVQPLMALADDEQASVWARTAALEALKACVVEGDADRDAIVAYAQDLALREAAAIRTGRPPSEPGFEFLNSVVALATDLGAVQMLPAIRGWFDERLLDEQHADLEFVEAAISEPFELSAQRMREQGEGYVRDPVSAMAWWACFYEEDDDGDADDIDWAPAARPYVRDQPKIGRNDPCPCGSGKKYKKCHGAVE